MSVQTITGFFDDEKNALQAVRDAEARGISPTDININAVRPGPDLEPTLAPTLEMRQGAVGTGASIGAVLGGALAF